MACIDGSILRVDVMAAQVRRIDRMLAQIAKVCYINKELYLTVTPSDVQYITADKPVTFFVRANGNWHVELE